MLGEDDGGPLVSDRGPAVAWGAVGDDDDGGPPVLLVPPLGRDRTAWSAQIEALAADFRCVLFDPRGTGQSRDVAGDHTVAAMAADATAVLDAVGAERAHVLGWSLGAAAAMALVTQRPERVASLTLITPWARTDPHVRAGLAIMRDLAVAAEPAAAEVATLWLILSRAAVNAAGEQLDLDARAAVEAPGYPRAEVLAAYCESGLEHDLLDELRSLDVPALVVGGDEDRLVDVAHARETAAAVAGATLRVMKGDGASHALPIERAAELNALVREFLDTLA
jgi:pimeloyl-ACP methyl ester carboxylesterase